MDYAILTLIGIIFIAREISTHRQIKQMQQTIDKLSDKVMSKDLREYKDLTEPTPSYQPVSLTEAEEWAREIEEEQKM